MIFLALSVLVGLLYPLATTGVVRLLWPSRPGGSLLEQDGRVVGSALIGQSFTDPRYFWGRPSATAPMPYNAAASGGSNLGPPTRRWRRPSGRASPPCGRPIPAIRRRFRWISPPLRRSGLDPHISPAAPATRPPAWRAPAAAHRHGGAAHRPHTERPVPDILGEPVVNVLALNLALDRLR
ncbi:K+-transporting ATPase, c chain family protein [Bordetella holmesii 70147]|nr:K+-transporting ATPase, c chain family protein [Bordetella holmesii 70147]